MIRLILLIVVLLLSQGCATVAGGRPNGDARAWQTHRVEMNGVVLSFRIPPNASLSYPNEPILTDVDLFDTRNFDSANEGPVIIERSWDYRKSRFVIVDGSLDFRISVERSEVNLDTPDALASAIRENERLWEMRDYLITGDRRARNDPTKFVITKIGNVLGVRMSFELSSDAYFVAISNNHYLSISVNSSGSREPKWTKDAKDASKVLLQSINIVRK